MKDLMGKILSQKDEIKQYKKLLKELKKHEKG
jgi:uncharacterized protein (DUF305 family)